MFRPDLPVRCALDYGVAERREASEGDVGGGRPERRSEALVGPLVRVDCRDDGGIDRIGWREGDPTIIAQRRIKRDCARRVEPVPQARSTTLTECRRSK